MQRLTWLVIAAIALAACDDVDGDDDALDGSSQIRDGAIVQDGAVGMDGAITKPDSSTMVPDGNVTTDADIDEDGGAIVPSGCDPDNAGIQLPEGFCAVAFADDLGHARHITVTSAGDVYVAVASDPDTGAGGGIVALRDSDGDLRADRIERFGTLGGNGILWDDDQLYFAANDQVLRYDLTDEQLTPAGNPETIVSGLPADGDHKAKSIALSGTDLYVNIGSASNSCQLANRELESPGIDPCAELNTRAGVWRFTADQMGQVQADGARFASGLRNTNALALNPANDSIYGAINGRDQLNENWPALFTPQDDQALPSEELVRLQQGQNYGWPYCFYDELMNAKVLAPEYGGDGEMVGRCADAEPPLEVYPAHWAPLALMFYTGEQFPERYRDGAFISFHGSRFAPDATGDLPGYNVVFQPFVEGVPSGAFEEFATGFAGDARPLPEQAAHRPVGLAMGPDGSLYIGDDHGGRIWRVIYVGE